MPGFVSTLDLCAFLSVSALWFDLSARNKAYKFDVLYSRTKPTEEVSCSNTLTSFVFA